MAAVTLSYAHVYDLVTFATHIERQVSASAANAGLWWSLRMGLGLIFKRHHRLTLAAAAAARCGYNLEAWCQYCRFRRIRKKKRYLVIEQKKKTTSKYTGGSFLIAL